MIQKDQVQEEQQIPEQIVGNFDPSGMWFVDSPAQLCTATSSYTDGYRMYTEPFYCNSLPLDDLIISKKINITYDNATGSVDVEDNRQVRRIPLFIDETGQYLVGLASAPLAGVDEHELAPGCKLTIRSFNGALFPKDDKNAMVYNINFWMDFRPVRETPTACLGTLGQLKNHLKKGQGKALYQFMYDHRIIDPERVQLLRNISIIYMYEAVKSQKL